MATPKRDVLKLGLTDEEERIASILHRAKQLIGGKEFKTAQERDQIIKNKLKQPEADLFIHAWREARHELATLSKSMRHRDHVAAKNIRKLIENPTQIQATVLSGYRPRLEKALHSPGSILETISIGLGYLLNFDPPQFPKLDEGQEKTAAILALVQSAKEEALKTQGERAKFDTSSRQEQQDFLTKVLKQKFKEDASVIIDSWDAAKKTFRGYNEQVRNTITFAIVQPSEAQKYVLYKLQEEHFKEPLETAAKERERKASEADAIRKAAEKKATEAAAAAHALTNPLLQPDRGLPRGSRTSGR